MSETTLEIWALTTVEKVKQQGSGIRSSDPTQDDAIRFLINAASEQFMRYSGREFVTASVGSTTRTFPVSPIQVYGIYSAYADFGRYDAQTVTGVVINSQAGAAGQVTLDTTQYQPLPVEKWDGVYTGVGIAGSSDWMASLPGIITTIDVTGTWGWPSVPDYVQRLCVEQVKAWLWNSYQVTNGIDLSGGVQQPAAPTLFRLSPAIEAALDQYKTMPVFC